MRKPKVAPTKRWAVVGGYVFGRRWILTHTIAFTRREAIAAWVKMWRDDLQPTIWRRKRRAGVVTCERVTVRIDNG